MTKSLKCIDDRLPPEFDRRLHKIYMLFRPNGTCVHDNFIGTQPVRGQIVITEKGVRGRILGKPHYSSVLGWTHSFEEEGA